MNIKVDELVQGILDVGLPKAVIKSNVSGTCICVFTVHIYMHVHKHICVYTHIYQHKILNIFLCKFGYKKPELVAMRSTNRAWRLQSGRES